MDVTDGGRDRLPVPDPASYAAIIERVQSTGWTRRPDAGTRRRAWISTVAGVGMQVAAVAVFSLGVESRKAALLSESDVALRRGTVTARPSHA